MTVSPIDVVARSDRFESAAAGVELRPWEWAFIHAVDGRMQIQEVAALCDLELAVAQEIVVEQTAAGLLRVVTMTLEDYRRWSGFELPATGAVAQAEAASPAREPASALPVWHDAAPAEEALLADDAVHAEAAARQADALPADTLSGDTVHADTVHADSAHADTVHADTAHADTVHAEIAPAEMAPAEPVQAEPQAGAVERSPAALADPGTIPEPLAFPDHFARSKPVALDLDVSSGSGEYGYENAAPPHTPAPDRFATESFAADPVAAEAPASEAPARELFALDGSAPDHVAPEASSRETYVTESFGNEPFASEQPRSTQSFGHEPFAAEPFAPEPFAPEPYTHEPFGHESGANATAAEPAPASKSVSFSFDSFDDFESLEPSAATHQAQNHPPESTSREIDDPGATAADVPGEGISLSFEPGDFSEPLPAEPLPSSPSFSSGGGVSLSFDSSTPLDADDVAPARDYGAPPPALSAVPSAPSAVSQAPRAQAPQQPGATDPSGPPVNLSFSPDGFPILTPTLSSAPLPNAAAPAPATAPRAEPVAAPAPQPPPAPPAAAVDPVAAPQAAAPPPANPGAPRHAANEPDIVGSLIARVLSIRIK